MEEFWKKLPQCERDKCLQDAFIRGNKELVKLVLLSGGISKAQATRDVYAAIVGGYSVEVVELLFDAGAEADREDLLNALTKGPEMVECLLENGVKPYSQAIIDSAENGYNDVLKKLLEAGGDAKTRASCPINKAVYEGWADCVSTLLEHGEQVTNIRPKVLGHAKRLAAKKQGYSNYVKTVEILKKAGLSID